MLMLVVLDALEMRYMTKSGSRARRCRTQHQRQLKRSTWTKTNPFQTGIAIEVSELSNASIQSASALGDQGLGNCVYNDAVSEIRSVRSFVCFAQNFSRATHYRDQSTTGVTFTHETRKSARTICAIRSKTANQGQAPQRSDFFQTKQTCLHLPPSRAAALA